jgi:hypothetical protein
MNTKTLSSRARSVIDQYRHFKVGRAVCSVPYFNNKTVRARAGIRAQIGKGSPQEIFEEVQTILIKGSIPADALADESLKKLLVDANLGLDCSAFAYYVLNAESEELQKGRLDKHLSFVKSSSLLGGFRSRFRPIENCDVQTLADNKNSRLVPVAKVQPGDMIVMTGYEAGPGTVRDHILIVHQVEYQNFVPTRIHYSHTMAYPEDGVYGSGIKEGIIEILDPLKSIIEERWSESGLFIRAQKSKTEIRRLNWF